MNCLRCNAPLAVNATFCGVCGTPVPGPRTNVSPAGSPSLRSFEADETIVAANWQGGERDPRAPEDTQRPMYQPPSAPHNAPWNSVPHSAQSVQSVQPPFQQSQMRAQIQPVYPSEMVQGTMSSTGTASRAPGRRRTGCLVRALLVTGLLVGSLLAGWFLGLRPYLHNLAASQLDQA